MGFKIKLSGGAREQLKKPAQGGMKDDN